MTIFYFNLNTLLNVYFKLGHLLAFVEYVLSKHHKVLQ
jgi:hypothetical protein